VLLSLSGLIRPVAGFFFQNVFDVKEVELVVQSPGSSKKAFVRLKTKDSPAASMGKSLHLFGQS
jgi:hypothetical protein